MAKKFYREDNLSIPATVYALSAPTGYTEITDDATLIECYTKIYVQREIDGQDYYNGFRSGLMLDIDREVILGSEAFALETHITTLKNEFLSGNWLTAQYINSVTTLSGLYDQTMKNKIQYDIDLYIATNY